MSIVTKHCIQSSFHTARHHLLINIHIINIHDLLINSSPTLAYFQHRVHSRELHGNGDNGNTAVNRSNTAVTGTTLYILPR